MLRQRKLLTAACVILIPGAVSAALLYALHLRNDAYRRATERMLGDLLGMHVSIKEIRSNGDRERLFRRIHVAMGADETEVFACAEATLHDSTTGAGGGRVLDLRDGWLLVGTAGWSKAEYERMLAGGLGHDFRALGLTEVRLHDIDLRFRHSIADFTAERASGVILFDARGDGRAELKCSRLNGVDVEEPVRIEGRFTPGKTLMLHEVSLSVASLPLSAIGFAGVLNQAPCQGEFAGMIRYRQTPAGDSADIRGTLRAADLLDFTDRLPGGPYHGTLDLEVESAHLQNGRLESLIGHGTVTDLRISEWLPGFARPATVGRLDLRIDPVRWIDGHMQYLSLTGRCEDLSLDALSSLWGPGRMTGSLALDIHSALVVDDRLRTADVEVEMAVPDNEPGLIDRDLLARVVKAWSGVDLRSALPDRIEYTRLGARLLLKDDELQVLGRYGPEGRTILSINFFGRSWDVIKQPDGPFQVPDLLAWLRSHRDEIDAERVRTWWEHLREQPP